MCFPKPDSPGVMFALFNLKCIIPYFWPCRWIHTDSLSPLDAGQVMYGEFIRTLLWKKKKKQLERPITALRIVKKAKLGVVRLSSQGKQQNQSFQQMLQNNTCLYDKALQGYCNLNHVFIFVTIPAEVLGPYQSSNFNPNHNVSLNLTKVFLCQNLIKPQPKQIIKWI